MNDDQDSARRGTSHSPLASRIRDWLRAAGNRLFGELDLLARQHGWQVQATQGGVGRAYRDPRFDLLASCESCGGSGLDELGHACVNCPGTGVIHRDQPACTHRRS